MKNLRRVIVAMLLAAGLSAAGEIRYPAQESPAEAEGVVTFARGWDVWFFLEQADGFTWRIERAKRNSTEIQEGQRVRVKGIRPKSSADHRINAAEVEVCGRAVRPRPLEMSTGDFYAPDPGGEAGWRSWWGRRVTVTGPVLDINRRATFAQILIGTAEESVQLAVPIQRWEKLPESIVLGAVVRATGVAIFSQTRDRQTNTATGVTDIGLQLGSVSDLSLAAPRPYWTPLRLQLVIGALVLLLGVGGILLLLMRRAVKRAAARLEVTLREKVRDRVESEAIRRERLRLSSELHDNLQQLLASCMFRLGAAVRLLAQEDVPAARAQLELLEGALNHTQIGLRSALWSMTEEAEGPSALSDLFKYAAGRMAHWEGLVHFSVTGEEPKVARQCSGALLMILQEAVGNAIRHGGATRVDVRVAFAEKELVLTIQDDGCGFNTTDRAPAGHLGLTGMQTRAKGLGGTLAVASTPGRGTTVTARIPLVPNP